MSVAHFDLFREASGGDRPTKVILFADLAGSTEMKSKMGEVAWLPTLGKFLDITSTAIRESGGTVVKYLGDGTLGAFDGEHAAEAIRAAIKIQEMLRTANSNGELNDCLATVGIATGRIIEYEAPGGGLDYVGSVVDLAARFCEACAPQAIWVDSATVASANMNKVYSQVGLVNDRSPDDYLTQEWKVELKGFPKPIKYREVIWHNKPFGATNEVVDELTERSQSSGDRPALSSNEPCEGVVKRWDPVRGFGFITAIPHGDYYVHHRCIVSGEALVAGRPVRFVPRPPFKEGASPVAPALAESASNRRSRSSRAWRALWMTAASSS